MLTGGNLPSFSAPSKAHSSQLLLPHSHPRRLSESSCTETTCSFSTVCITLPQKRDKVNRNSSCLIRFLQKSLTISCHLFIPHHLKPNEERLIEYIKAHPNATIAELAESMKVGTSTVNRAVTSLKRKGVLDRKGGNIAHMNQIRTLPETVSLPTASTWACTSSSEMAKAGWQNRQDTCRHSVIRNAVVGRFLYC